MSRLQTSIYHSLLVSLTKKHGEGVKEFTILSPDGNVLKKVKSTPAGVSRTAVVTKGFIDMEKGEFGNVE